MKLYLLRHGRTAWNEAGKIQGRTDIPLGEEGRRSALEAGAALADIPFSAAFSSPLRRAKETAEIILGARKDILRTDERLIELNFGAAEGMCLRDMESGKRPTTALFEAPERYVPPRGGESYEALLARCRAFLEEEILPNEKVWEHVLIVSHGAAVRGMFGAMFGARAGEIYGRRVQKNCAVNVIGCSSGAFAPLHIARVYCETV